MKVGQGDLLFVCNRFATWPVHARLQVSVQRLRFVPPCLSENLICPFLPRSYKKVGQTPGICCTYRYVRYTHNQNLVTAGQQVAEIMQR